MIKKFVIIVTNKAPVGEKFWGEERNMEGDSLVPQKRIDSFYKFFTKYRERRLIIFKA